MEKMWSTNECKSESTALLHYRTLYQIKDKDYTNHRLLYQTRICLKLISELRPESLSHYNLVPNQKKPFIDSSTAHQDIKAWRDTQIINALHSSLQSQMVVTLSFSDLATLLWLPLDKWLNWHQNWSGCYGEQKILCVTVRNQTLVPQPMGSYLRV